jgi:hypothetical protein
MSINAPTLGFFPEQWTCRLKGLFDAHADHFCLIAGEWTS